MGAPVIHPAPSAALHGQMRETRQQATRGIVLLFVGCATALGACLGDIGDPGEGGPDTLACGDTPGRVGLARLTRAEYNRTVRDLFGVTSEPANTFPPDSATSGFDNNASSLTTSPQLAKLLLDTAETVAAEAMVNKKSEIVICDLALGDACARDTLSALALKVYRRPATSDEIDDLMLLMAFAKDEGDTPEAGVEYALSAMLIAPQFLYRGVPISVPEPGEAVVALDDFALATRLSYFLWGSTPDDTLLARAADGVLHDETALRAELDRMLADPKADALFDGFVKQWLQLGKLEQATPDPVLFPVFTEELRAEMLDETRLFFESLRERDGSALELITGNQTFANEALADIYGVSGVSGPELVSVATDPAERAGLLTVPAILTMTSNPTTPNIVKRGVWLAEAILCAAPPPPPEGVPLEVAPKPGETERERLARHRQDPSCASCHDLIDPLGFAFEGYDAIGRWRGDVDGEPVDDAGTLPDGTAFTGVVELAEVLSEGDGYSRCVTEKLMTYALGRTIDKADACTVSAIGSENVTPTSRLSDLLWAIVMSPAFQTEEVAP